MHQCIICQKMSIDVTEKFVTINCFMTLINGYTKNDFVHYILPYFIESFFFWLNCKYCFDQVPIWHD